MAAAPPASRPSSRLPTTHEKSCSFSCPPESAVRCQGRNDPWQTKLPNSTEAATVGGSSSGLLTKVAARVRGLFSRNNNATPMAASVCKP